MKKEKIKNFERVSVCVPNVPQSGDIDRLTDKLHIAECQGINIIYLILESGYHLPLSSMFKAVHNATTCKVECSRGSVVDIFQNFPLGEAMEKVTGKVFEYSNVKHVPVRHADGSIYKTLVYELNFI